MINPTCDLRQRLLAHGAYKLAFLLCSLLLALGALIYAQRSHAQRASASAADSLPAQQQSPKASETYGRLPLSFETNAGQADAAAQYVARGPGYKLSLKATEATLKLRTARGTKPEAEGRRAALKSRKRDAASESTLSMKLVGARATAQAEAQGELPTRSNYLVGNDPAKWRTNVFNYERVKYAQVYPGIDIVYYGNQRQLEYDFIVAPGASPANIRLAFSGALERLEIGPQGELVLSLKEGVAVRSSKPLVYQEREGVRHEVAARYTLLSKTEVGFEIGDYDRTRPLVIDPVLVYSTYLDFFNTSLNSGITTDSSNNVYVTGSDGDNVFVGKLNPAGTAFVYTTLIGGGSGDSGMSIAVDASGNAYVSGDAYSNDFPVVNAFQSVRSNVEVNVADTFVFKLDPGGTTLLFSTFLGGGDDDNNFGIKLDASGNAYVTGLTASPASWDTDDAPFPTVNPYQSTNAGSYDGYLTKFNSTGGVVYSTYLGGGDDDYALDVAVDSSGNAYLTGQTYSPDFPQQNPLQPALASASGDAFVTKFNAAGSALVFSTYLGGGGEDLGWGIALDGSQNVYLTGYTRSVNFPRQNPLQSVYGGSVDGFVTKLNAAGSALVYSTYLGGLSTEESSDIYVNAAGESYVVGYTSSSNFPTVNPLQSSNNGGTDAFISKLNAAGSALVFSTYLGGSAGGPTGTEADWASGVTLDAGGNVYMFGETYSSNFPTVNALEPTLPSYESAVLAKISESGNQTFYTISGRIESNAGNPMPGVTVTLSGTQTATAQTSDFGSYSFTGLAAGGTYTVTPTRTGTTFDPLNQTFENLSADQNHIDFMTAPRTYHINGRVTDASGNGLAGVRIDITGYYYPIERTTDAEGEFVLMYLEGNREYTVTPRHETYSFTPLSRTFLLNSNQTPTFTATNNTGLSINLTSPADGAAFQAPADITLSATAASTNSTITKVEFFANHNLVGTDTTAPYSFNWTGVAGGNYSIHALVTDAAGATKQSNDADIIVNSVNGPSVQITNPADGATFVQGGYIIMSANASSPAGTITRVDFYEGIRLIGSDDGSANPYTVIYFLYEGSYTLTAVATDSTGAVRQSSPVHITVVRNQYPSVQLTSPTNGAQFPAGSNITLVANATDPDGTIAQVRFWANGSLLRTDLHPPFNYNWLNVQAGDYTLVLSTTDDQGATSWSNPIDIKVGNRKPSVSIMSPSSGAQYAAPASIKLDANALDTDGSISKVEFFADGTLVGTDTTVPYSITWTGVAEGDYTIVAKATDNEGATATSTFIFVRVFGNVPDVSITAPNSGESFAAPATIDITADASSASSTISYVSFYAGTQHLGNANTPPYSIQWSNVPVGAYSITAVATDLNSAMTTSAPVNITVTGNVGNWHQQVPAIPGNLGILEDVEMVSATEGWAVGEGGTILHTPDGGRTWTSQMSGTTAPLHGVSFFDALHGVAVGNEVLYTIDGGQTWQPGTRFGNLGTLYGVDFVDLNTAYASGGGTIMKTTDGGRTWSPQNVPVLSFRNLVSVDFVDQNTGWAVGANGSIIATTDGGANWTLQASNTNNFFGGVSFVSATEGWTVAGNVVLHTTNGGQTWTQQSVPQNTWVASVHFVDALNGWAAGTQENIIRTSDGGQTWVTQRGGTSTPFIYPFNGISMGDALHGIAVGNAGTIVSTIDGGLTWRPVQGNYTSVSNRIFALDSAHAWSANSNAEILSTTDGGSTWNRASLFTPTANSDVTDIDFTNNLNGWATVKEGPPGFVYKSTDGGLTWQNAGAPQTGALHGVEATGNQTVVAVGWDGSTGRILRSTDNGATWSNQSPPDGAAVFYAVNFIDATTGWVVGNGGTIMKSTDGGATWARQTSGLTQGNLLSVSFVDGNNGWAAGGNRLLHTTDGGQTWNAQSAGLDASIYAVHGVSPAVAWISGFDGLVAQTTDGGATWARDNLDTDATLKTCFFLDAENGWVGGEQSGSPTLTGRIYRRTGTGTPSTPAPLTITLTSPANGATFTDPNSITVSATVSMNGRASVSQVDFYDGATLIGTDTTAPYSLLWTNVPAGSHTITARATLPARGLSTASFTNPANINVVSTINQSPSVTLTSPVMGARYLMGTSINLSANASDNDGSISKVEFYAGPALIGTDTASPYQMTWTAPAIGGYQLTAVAYDNQNATTSNSVSITVNQRGAGSLIADFDGDGKTDISVFRPADGYWHIFQSAEGIPTAQQWGASGDKPAPGDYDGDGKTDVAVFRPTDGNWYILRSSDSSFIAQSWGLNADKPVAADFDGDGKTDIAVFRPAEGNWYILRSSDGSFTAQQWGTSEDKPAPGDYDGDGKADLAVFRPSANTWYILRSSDNALSAQSWGLSADKPVAADFDGDGKTDIAVFRPSTSTWHILNSSDGSTRSQQWGLSTDRPAPGDYDGDGKTDVAVFRPSNATFYILKSTDSAMQASQWGANGDLPAPSAYIP
ncbi:MAG: Ig-like domain-containing protein [Pyrinomonadaceae bacterium]